MFWLHAGIIAVAIAFAYSMYMKTLRLKSSFNLYKVRDSFVLLVASGVIEEKDPVFKYYYSRINSLLKLSPNVGMDDMIQVMLQQYKKSPERFNELVDKARAKIEELSSQPSFERVEVRMAASEYYEAFKFMVLAHSSILRLGYVLSQFALGRCIEKTVNFLPQDLQHGVRMIKLAENESKSFAS